jgi:hypothetical protein
MILLYSSVAYPLAKAKKQHEKFVFNNLLNSFIFFMNPFFYFLHVKATLDKDVPDLFNRNSASPQIADVKI